MHQPPITHHTCSLCFHPLPFTPHHPPPRLLTLRRVKCRGSRALASRFYNLIRRSTLFDVELKPHPAPTRLTLTDCRAPTRLSQHCWKAALRCYLMPRA
jgi:hypothetical protein